MALVLQAVYNAVDGVFRTKVTVKAMNAAIELTEYYNDIKLIFQGTIPMRQEIRVRICYVMYYTHWKSPDIIYYVK